MEWGVYPHWMEAKGDTEDEIKAQRKNQINARSERIIQDSKSLWYRLKEQRCLIPVSGIYEHREIKTWSKKVPYYITEAGRDLFYIPGLYQFHETVDDDGVLERVGSFSMITRAANGLMAGIHNHGPNKHRMPLFLPENMEKEWLMGIDQKEMAEILAFEMPADNLDYTPVYSLRNSERPDGKHRYDPYTWPNLPPVGNDTPLSAQTTLF